MQKAKKGSTLVRGALERIDELTDEIEELFTQQSEFNQWVEGVESILRPQLRFAIARDMVRIKQELDLSDPTHLKVSQQLDEALAASMRFPSIDEIDRKLWFRRKFNFRLSCILLFLGVVIFGHGFVRIGGLIILATLGVGGELALGYFRAKVRSAKQRFRDTIPLIKAHVEKTLTQNCGISR